MELLKNDRITANNTVNCINQTIKHEPKLHENKVQYLKPTCILQVQLNADIIII